MTTGRIRIVIAIAVVAALGAGAWFFLTRGRESTDDAQVDAHVTPIAARVGGTVLRVPVTDNQPVEAGTVRLVGTDRRRIFDAVSEVLTDAAAYDRMSRAHNPYGDGHAAALIAATLRDSPGLAP